MFNPFQYAANFINSIKTPKWLKDFFQEVQDIMIILAKQTGQNYIDFLETKIIEVADGNMSNTAKFNAVWEAARSGIVTAVVTLKDAELKLLIEFLVNKLKKKNIID
jgi:methyltransferase-like protein